MPVQILHNQYSWELGFLHSYNVVLRVDNNTTAEDHDTIFAGLAQARENIGLMAHSHMSSQRSTAEITRCAGLQGCNYSGEASGTIERTANTQPSAQTGTA